jgi:hypothetical protein
MRVAVGGDLRGQVARGGIMAVSNKPTGRKAEPGGPYTKLIALGTILLVVLGYVAISYPAHWIPFSPSPAPTITASRPRPIITSPAPAELGATPGGPATISGLVRWENWPSRMWKGRPPKWSPWRWETKTAAIPPGSSPRRLRALSAVAPQSRSTGSSPPDPRRWIQAWKRPPLPKASPLPAKVTVRADSSGTVTLWLSGPTFAPVRRLAIEALCSQTAVSQILAPALRKLGRDGLVSARWPGRDARNVGWSRGSRT